MGNRRQERSAGGSGNRNLLLYPLATDEELGSLLVQRILRTRERIDRAFGDGAKLEARLKESEGDSSGMVQNAGC
ncbi:MAG TPA: hypothetical protein VF704_02870 [Allosphingosinicella sp.]|jgi:hypothetical protein